MGTGNIPQSKLALKVLPKPLREAIEVVFNQNLSGCALVGGTCLAGYYAGHRRSDDMDLFVRNTQSFQATVLALKELVKKNYILSEEMRTQQYYHALCQHPKHSFTIDIVLDENIFRVGKFIKLENHVVVADLVTILKMKAATLVSRCSEKDLFDLYWLFDNFSKMTILEFITHGHEIDGGVNAENMLASLAGTELHEGACEFGVKESAPEIFSKIKTFQTQLIHQLRQHLKSQPTPPLGLLVRKMKK